MTTNDKWAIGDFKGSRRKKKHLALLTTMKQIKVRSLKYTTRQVCKIEGTVQGKICSKVRRENGMSSHFTIRRNKESEEREGGKER